MALDGLLTYNQSFRYVAVAHTVRYQSEYLQLSFA